MEIGHAARAFARRSKAKLHLSYVNLLDSTSRFVGQAKRFAREIVDGTKRAASDVAQTARVLEGRD
jgi:hypothetical protein